MREAGEQAVAVSITFFPEQGHAVTRASEKGEKEVWAVLFPDKDPKTGKTAPDARPTGILATTPINADAGFGAALAQLAISGRNAEFTLSLDPRRTNGPVTLVEFAVPPPDDQSE